MVWLQVTLVDRALRSTMAHSRLCRPSLNAFRSILQQYAPQLRRLGSHRVRDNAIHQRLVSLPPKPEARNEPCGWLSAPLLYAFRFATT